MICQTESLILPIEQAEAWCTPRQHVVLRVVGRGFAECVVFDVNSRFRKWQCRGLYDPARARMLVETADALAAWLRVGLGFTGPGGDA